MDREHGKRSFDGRVTFHPTKYAVLVVEAQSLINFKDNKPI
jgi:hypothetical protein